MDKGTKVKILGGQLGLMTSRDGTRFVSDTLNYGDVAVYDGPHPNPELAEKGWDLLTVERDGRTLWCPVHDSMYEVATTERQPPVEGLKSLLF